MVSEITAGNGSPSHSPPSLTPPTPPYSYSIFILHNKRLTLIHIAYQLINVISFITAIIEGDNRFGLQSLDSSIIDNLNPRCGTQIQRRTCESPPIEKSYI